MQRTKSKQEKKNKITEIKVVITEEDNKIDNNIICKTEESKASNRITKIEFIKNKYRTLLARMAL